MHAQTAMFGSEKTAAPPPVNAPSPSPPPPPLPPPLPLRFPLFEASILKLWRALDVSVMLLLSLLLQFALLILGKRRKHSVSLSNNMILWLAYQNKEWITIAALGKLFSYLVDLRYNSHGAIDFSLELFHFKFLPSLWAPLLLLHLSGPDTITAFSFQDTQLKAGHFLTLVVQCFLAFCIIILSMNLSFFLVFTIPLYFVGISKYIEMILCLKVNNSMKTKPINSVFKGPDHRSHPLLDHQESEIVLLGYAMFSAMRPDVNDFLYYKEYPLSFRERIQRCLRKTNDEVKLIQRDLMERSSSYLLHFDMAVVQLGFIFDTVYTKAAFIYTRKGCILRLTSFTLSIGILFFFLISFRDFLKSKGTVDIFLTMILLVGAVALDIFALLSILCSDWVIVLMHDNCLVRKILKYVLQYFPCFLPQQKRWSARMGQFDLLDYCWNSRKAKVYRFLQKYCSCDTIENWYRFKYTRFVEVPSCLKPKEVYQRRLDSFFSSDSFKATRGKRTFDELREEISYIYPDLERSIKLDFDASIVAWHLATSICYHQDYDPNNGPNEAMKSSKYLPDYMMYLLVMQPAMLLPENYRSFWLDRVLDKLRDPLSKQSNKNVAFNLLLQDLSEFRSPLTALDNLPEFAGYLSTKLNQTKNKGKKWELIKAMWIEVLLYAAYSCQHMTHVKQLGKYGREFLTINLGHGRPSCHARNDSAGVAIIASDFTAGKLWVFLLCI